MGVFCGNLELGEFYSSFNFEICQMKLGSKA